MKLWNCGDLDKLGGHVLESYQRGRVPRRTRPSISSASSKITIGTAVIAMAAAFSISTGAASGPRVFLPFHGVRSAQSLRKPAPSVEQEFDGRFDSEWTVQHEVELLGQLESRRHGLSEASYREAVLDSIYSNQNEDPTDDTAKLTREGVKKVLKKRRTG